MSWLGVAAAVGRRPRLWSTAARQARRLVPPRWWARRPHLPAPDRAWLRFRTETQYGDPDHRPEPDDVVAWLDWARRSPGAGRRQATCRSGSAGHK
jgi:hypothetical protein